MSQSQSMNLYFSPKSVQLLDRIELETWTSLRDRVVRRVVDAGRTEVTEGDVRACVKEALQDVISQQER